MLHPINDRLPDHQIASVDLIVVRRLSQLNQPIWCVALTGVVASRCVSRSWMTIHRRSAADTAIVLARWMTLDRWHAFNNRRFCNHFISSEYCALCLRKYFLATLASFLSMISCANSASVSRPLFPLTLSLSSLDAWHSQLPQGSQQSYNSYIFKKCPIMSYKIAFCPVLSYIFRFAPFTTSIYRVDCFFLCYVWIFSINKCYLSLICRNCLCRSTHYIAY